MTEGNGLRAVVVGAGIGGLSCAVALQRGGAEVTVHERMPELREVGSGLTLWVNAMRALQDIGVADRIAERGAAVGQIDNRTAEGKYLSTIPIREIARKHSAESVSIHRGELQQGLSAELRDGTVRLGSECTGFEQDPKGVTVRFADGSEERADMLIGADGRKSTVCSQLFPTQSRYAGYTCWRSAVELEHPLLDRDVYIQLYGTRSTFGIFPIARGWSWYGTQFAQMDGGGGNGAAWKEEARRAFSGWYGAVQAVIEATPEDAFVRQDIYDRVPIDNWVSDRVAVTGDAAHATTPTLGQGACMAIEDAAVIGRAFSQGMGVQAALQRYQSERMGRANGIVNQAWRHGKLYHGVTPPLRIFRDRVFLRAPKAIVMREVDKLMGYKA